MQEDNTHAQLKNIDTSQPTPLKGLVLRGVKEVETVKTERGGIVEKENNDEKEHGEIVMDKLPTRKKKPADVEKASVSVSKEGADR